MKSKIIQIEVIKNAVGDSVMVALCQDGTIWFTQYTGGREPFEKWKRGPATDFYAETE